MITMAFHIVYINKKRVDRNLTIADMRSVQQSIYYEL